MTRTVTGPELRPTPRFTFAGRGCRDSRREPRRLPQSLRLPSPAPSTAATSPVTAALSEAGRPPAVGSTTSTAAVDRPPPATLRYGPVPCQTPTGLWWSSGAAMRS